MYKIVLFFWFLYNYLLSLSASAYLAEMQTLAAEKLFNEDDCRLEEVEQVLWVPEIISNWFKSVSLGPCWTCCWITDAMWTHGNTSWQPHTSSSYREKQNDSCLSTALTIDFSARRWHCSCRQEMRSRSSVRGHRLLWTYFVVWVNAASSCRR